MSTNRSAGESKTRRAKSGLKRRHEHPQASSKLRRPRPPSAQSRHGARDTENAHIRVDRVLRDQDNDEYYLRLAFTNGDGATTYVIVPRRAALQPRAVLEQLADAGAPFLSDAVAKRKLIDKLLKFPTSNASPLIRRSGWTTDGAFNMGGRIIGGPSTGSVIVALPEPVLTDKRRKGKLDDWRRTVAEPSANSSRLMFVLALAFSAPLLHHCPNAESGVVNFWGTSTIGKSLALLVVNSVFRSGRRADLLTWDVTTIGLQELAFAYCDTALCLDETQRGTMDHDAAIVKVRGAAFALASGVGRKRSRHSDGNSMPLSWRIVTISSSEEPFYKAKFGAANQRRTGDLVRLFDIPAGVHQTFGIFEQCPKGVQSSVELAHKIEAGCAANFGTAGRVFIRKFARERVKWLVRVACWRVEFHTEVGSEAKAFERRFADRFALAYAAARAAIAMGILPWTPQDLLAAIIACYRDATFGAAIQPEDVKQVLLTVKQQLRDRATVLDLREGPYPNRKSLAAADGFITSQADKTPKFAIKVDAFTRWCDSPAMARAALDALMGGRHLLCSTDGRSPHRQVQIEGIAGRPRYVCIRMKFAAN